MRYLVALDGSDSSRAGLWAAIHMANPKTDTIFLLRVIEDSKRQSILISSGPAVSGKDRTEQARESLFLFSRICKNNNIVSKMILATSDHVGETVCKVAEEQHVEFIFMGKRGHSLLKQLIVGSTSQYCINYANCSVNVVKLEPSHEEFKNYEEAYIAMKSHALTDSTKTGEVENLNHRFTQQIHS